ncbi:PREDICTED: uncharacterized protein LOC101300304 [Fragaria vesca subsp. vesca]|uniref:uncharacterized protein LOC101300304 n=1 Tax=Fragaria vesca subsp. vesca TaxID=101020 RepID=UPI0002C328E9|nr:PREDICTED: uncharacterized protein LOC101300304 [Fragaria vesca subsp. vesca]
MKGRSHRFQSSDPPDDWVDESWTVDCLCGVTFDDGEEMVNCDECGVWVHTRCSRYVKGDDNFVCDKCKRRNSRNDSEETEVAQLLVELPTKTVRMESSFPPPPSMPARRPLRLWTDIPMEERVHVQGIPGGDPALFGGLSSVFTPELWKSTGYVPKKFNFQYREFPCWDKKEEADDRFDEDSENAVDKGAGVLFSLLNESVLANPVAALVGMRSREGGYDKRVSLKETKRWDKEVRDLRCAQSGGKKERSLLRPMVLHTGKRKKDDLGTSKDRIAKKRARAAEKEADARKRGAQSSKSVFTPSSDAKQLEFSEDRGPKISKADVQSVKYKRSSNSVVREPATNVSLATDYTVEKHSSEALLSDRSKTVGDGLKEDKVEHQVSTVPGNMTITKMDDAAVASLLELNDASRTDCLQEQGDSTEDDNVNVKPPIENVSTPPEVEDQNHCPTGDRSIQRSPNGKTEDHEDISRSLLDVQSSLHGDAKDLGKCSDQVSESAKDNAVTLNIPLSSDQKVQSAEKTSEAVDSHTDRGDVVSGDCQPKRESESLAGSITLQKCSSDVKHGSKLSEDLSKAGGILNSAATPGQLKTTSSAGKSSTVPCTSLTPKSSTPQNLKSGDVQNPNPFTKQRVVSESKVSIKKDRASSADMDHDKDNMPRKIVKEHLRSPTSSALKTPHFSRNSHDSVSKRTTSESKDSLLHSSSKTLSEGDTAVPAGSSEKVHGQNKSSASSAMQRGEKLNQTTSSKTSQNHAPPACPPAPSSSQAKLSDEELALLLHQELNSSPRVPRVPRARHASSLPQLASPTAASMLIKRTSSSSGKDHNAGSRRKVRDAYKDGVRSSRELDDEAKKMDRVPSSPDRRRQDTASTVDAAAKREENASSTASHSYKKTIPSTSIPTASSGRSSSTEANDRNLPSVRSSPRNVSDDDMGAVGPVHHTLPGLINEIMSKGRRMTYEELCNAVMPHWHNLRKHNGERYAYTSPSQAVLDCLRNRHEWARLVDRGPKTNPRKKRRPDADDSEDNEYGRVNPKELDSKSIDTQREDFPKGKRKARKRRRLALHGRGIKDVREKRKTDVLTDDDVGPSFSNSTEETVSEDDNQGGGAGPVGSEATSSSEEAGTS